MYATYPSFGTGISPLCQNCGRPLELNEVQCRNCGFFNTPGQANAIPSTPAPWGNGVQQAPFPPSQQWSQSQTQSTGGNPVRKQFFPGQPFESSQSAFGGAQPTTMPFMGASQQPYIPTPASQPFAQWQPAPVAGLPVQNLQVVPPAAVLFDNVTFQIGKRKILEHINLYIKRGAITGLLGPNGTGKTTLLSSIMGLRHPTSGTITVLDEKLPSHSAKLRQSIGVVLQETALYDELTTLENLRFAASLYNIPNPRQRINEVLELLALTQRIHDKVKNLSGGLQRRVTIARALLHSPDLLIIDEPTLGVDVDARHAIWSHLRLLRSTGTTVLVSTNYLDEALALCDAVAVLRAGRLLIVDAPDALVARAGSCLDVECSASACEVIIHALTRVQGILRVNRTSTGLSIFLRGNTVSDNVVRVALQTANIKGFRTRGADLAEVFHALEGISA